MSKKHMMMLLLVAGVAFAETNPFAGPDRPTPAPTPPGRPSVEAPAPPSNLTALPTPGNFPQGVPMVTPPRATLPDRLKELVRSGFIAPPQPTPERLTSTNVTLPVTIHQKPAVEPILVSTALNHLLTQYPDEAIRRYLRNTPTELLGTVTARDTTAIMSIAGVPKRLQEGDTLPNTLIRVSAITNDSVTLLSGKGSATIKMAGRP